MNVNTALADCANYAAGPDTTPLYSYDAENHHISTSLGADWTNRIQWSPGGHAYNFEGWTLHYDGDQILFVTDSNGTLRQAKVDALADINEAAYVTVLDRGVSNEYVSQHNGAYYSGVSLGTSLYRPAGSSASSQSVPYIFYGSTNDPMCKKPGAGQFGASCSGLGNLEYTRLEGFAYNGLTFQGVRAVDDASGHWTTPDAYAGDVHDPMSQKAFMWDRNNPYAYSDPSGFVPQRFISCECGTPVLRAVPRQVAYIFQSRGVPGPLLPLIERWIIEGNAERAAAARAASAERLGASRAQGLTFEEQTGTAGAKSRVQYPNGRIGYPDKLTATTIEEAKSGMYQSYTRQLAGQQEYARQFGLDHYLHMREGSTVSAPLRKAIDTGRIILRLWP